MEQLSGCLVAHLADRNEIQDMELAAEINRRIKPPKMVTPDDVYIRAMYIVSDQVNSQGGCFADEELDHLTELLVDSPVMVGHKQDSLPLARNFKAERVTLDGRRWVKSYFYWMKDSEGAEDLRNNIDGGIYKECSISFLFRFPECSICGQDIRRCQHIPFQEYEISSGKSDIAYFRYRQIEKVLETSLVFRGAVPDTRITDKLSDASADVTGCTTAAVLFSKTSDPVLLPDQNIGFAMARMQFESWQEYKTSAEARLLLVYPYQPGLVVRVTKRAGQCEIKTDIILLESVRERFLQAVAVMGEADFVADFLIYATKGKERLDGLGLMPILASGNNCHRLKFRLCDLFGVGNEDCRKESYQKRIEIAQQRFQNKTGGCLEIIRPKIIPPKEWLDYLVANNPNQYNFGLEVLSENTECRLYRQVLTVNRLIRGVIKEVKVRRAACLMLLGGREHTVEVVHPLLNKLEKGTTILLSRMTGNIKDDKNGYALVDLLPGTGWTGVAHAEDTFSSSNNSLFWSRTGECLTLYFREKSQWQQVRVHHFSPRLFGMNRRFIADLNACDGNCSNNISTAVPLKTIVRSGKLLFMCLTNRSALFGDISEMLLRPVLIDGEERYLFYANQGSRRLSE